MSPLSFLRATGAFFFHGSCFAEKQDVPYSPLWLVTALHLLDNAGSGVEQYQPDKETCLCVLKSQLKLKANPPEASRWCVSPQEQAVLTAVLVSPPGLHDLHGEAELPLGLQRLLPLQQHQARGCGAPEELPALLPPALRAGHVLQREQGTGLAILTRPLCAGGSAALMWLLSPGRMAVCSVPPVKPSMERKPVPSPKGRWRSPLSPSPCQGTRTVGQSGLCITSAGASR